ncbi:MAG: hypothetical protein WDN28_31695 [Chthoniobacter sp.]
MRRPRPGRVGVDVDRARGLLFPTQAGSIGSDLLPAAYALAALAFGLRARRSGSWTDFCLSALAAALITGVKVTAAPLALPWLVATLPCWRSIRNHWIGAAGVALVAVTISFVPTAAMNIRHTGSWNGDPENFFNAGPGSGGKFAHDPDGCARALGVPLCQRRQGEISHLPGE